MATLIPTPLNLEAEKIPHVQLNMRESSFASFVFPEPTLSTAV